MVSQTFVPTRMWAEGTSEREWLKAGWLYSEIGVMVFPVPCKEGPGIWKRSCIRNARICFAHSLCNDRSCRMCAGFQVLFFRFPGHCDGYLSCPVTGSPLLLLFLGDGFPFKLSQPKTRPFCSHGNPLGICVELVEMVEGLQCWLPVRHLASSVTSYKLQGPNPLRTGPECVPKAYHKPCAPRLLFV